jgi:hypothetical protein
MKKEKTTLLGDEKINAIYTYFLHLRILRIHHIHTATKEHKKEADKKLIRCLETWSPWRFVVSKKPLIIFMLQKA